MDASFSFFDTMDDPPAPANEPLPKPTTLPGTAVVEPAGRGVGGQKGNEAKGKVKANAVVTKRFCACMLCEEERETSDLAKGFCKSTVGPCSSDIACIEKGVARCQTTKKKYYSLKNNKDKAPWRMFCIRWQHVVGPAMGRGIPRGDKFDYLVEMEQFECGIIQTEGRRGRWMTFFKASSHWKEELNWDRGQSLKQWNLLLQSSVAVPHPVDPEQTTMFIHEFDYGTEENFKKKAEVMQAGVKTKKNVGRDDARDAIGEMMEHGAPGSLAGQKFGRVFHRSDGTGGQDLNMTGASADVDMDDLLDSIIDGTPLPAAKAKAKAKAVEQNASDGVPLAPEEEFDIQTRMRQAKIISNDIGKIQDGLAQSWAAGSFLLSSMPKKDDRSVSDSCRLLELRLRTLEGMINWTTLSAAATALANKVSIQGPQPMQASTEWLQHVSTVPDELRGAAGEKLSLEDVAKGAAATIKEGVPFHKLTTFAKFEEEVSDHVGHVKSQTQVDKMKRHFTGRFAPLESFKSWLRDNIRDVTSERKASLKQTEDTKGLARAALSFNSLRPEAHEVDSQPICQGIFNVDLAKGAAFTQLAAGANIEESGFPWCVTDVELCKHVSRIPALKCKVIIGTSHATKAPKANTSLPFAGEDIQVSDLAQLTSSLMQHGPAESCRCHVETEHAMPSVFAMGTQYEDTNLEPGQLGAARITLVGTYRHVAAPYAQVYEYMQQTTGTDKVKASGVVKFFSSVTQDDVNNMIDAGVHFRFMMVRPGNITFVPLGWISAVQNTGTKIVMGLQKGFVSASAMGNGSFSAIADPIRAFTEQFPKKARLYKLLQSRKQV